MSGMISDGKRMRPVWKPGDGDGDSARHLVERSLGTLKGHPTWKVFDKEIFLPIIPGSEYEPPRYVYLDDKACYTIWRAQAYTKGELRDYWPFDFDHLGNIKTGRKNRGYPAYLGDSEMQYAQAPMRGKKMYAFCGELEVTGYAPLRPKFKTKMEALVAQEFAQAKARKIEKAEEPHTIGKVIDVVKHIQPMAAAEETSGKKSMKPTRNAGQCGSYPQTPTQVLQWKRLVFSQPITPLRLGIGPKSISPSPGAPNGNAATTRAKRTPLSTRVHSVSQTTRDDVSDAFPSKKQRCSFSTPINRSFIQAFEISSDISPPSPSPKRVYIRPNSNAPMATKRKTGIFGGDGANDDQSECEDEEPLAMCSLHSQVDQLKSELNTERKAKADLTRDNNELRAQLRSLSVEHKHFRTALGICVTGKIMQESDLTKILIALQKQSDDSKARIEQLKCEAEATAAKIAPTRALWEGIGTVLDDVGKYMYDHGLDEEWKTLEKGARLRREAESSGPLGSQRTWNFC